MFGKYARDINISIRQSFRRNVCLNKRAVKPTIVERLSLRVSEEFTRPAEALPLESQTFQRKIPLHAIHLQGWCNSVFNN